jgi:hypothetical protein
MDPDPDQAPDQILPSSSKNSEKNLCFCSFGTSLLLFIFEE